MKKLNVFGSQMLFNYALSQLQFEGKFVYMAGPGQTETISPETRVTERKTEALEQNKDVLARIEDSPNYKLSKPAELLARLESDSAVLKVNSAMMKKLNGVADGRFKNQFASMAKEGEPIRLKAVQDKGVMKFGYTIGNEKAGGQTCFFENADVQDATVYEIGGINVYEDKGLESAAEKSARRADVVKAFLAIDSLSTDVKACLENRHSNAVLTSMIMNLVDVSARDWSTAEGTQKFKKENFKQQAEALVSEFNGFVDGNKKGIAQVLSDGKAEVIFEKNKPEHKAVIDKLKSRQGWGAFPAELVTQITRQTEVIGMTMERLRDQITDSPGDKELTMGELINNSQLKGKKWAEISTVEKAALTQILIAVQKLPASLGKESAPAVAPAQARNAPADLTALRAEEIAKIEGLRTQLKEFQGVRDDLMNDEKFHEKVRDYIKDAKAILHGSQVFFGRSFNDTEVTIKAGKENYSLKLGESSLHFVSPEKARQYWEKVNSSEKKQGALFIIPVEDLIKNPDGKVRVTKSPDVLDWSVLEEGWNGAKKLYGLLNDSKATEIDKEAALHALQGYESRNPNYFTMEDSLAKKNPSELKGPEKDIVMTVQAVEAVLALYRNPGDKGLQAKVEAVLKQNGQFKTMGIETLLVNYVNDKKSAGDPRLAKFDQSFLDQTNYGLADSLNFKYNVETSTTQEFVLPAPESVEGQTYEKYLNMLVEWKKEYKVDADNAGLSRFSKDSPQGIDRQKAMEYFAADQEMRNAIQVVDHHYSDTSTKYLIFTRESGKGRNSVTGEKIFAGADGYKLEKGESLAGFSAALQELGKGNASKEDVQAFLKTAKMDLIGVDQAKEFVSQNIDGAAFAPSALDGNGNMLVNISDEALKNTLIAKSDSAKAVQEQFNQQIAALNAAPGSKISVTVDGTTFDWNDASWSKVMDVALVAIPGRLNESVAFRIKDDIKLKLTTKKTEERTHTEDLDMARPQMLVTDVFNTYRVLGPMDWVGKMVTSPGKIEGEFRELWRDLVDSSGVLPVGSDKTHEERVPRESRVETKLEEARDNMKAIVEKAAKSEVTVGEILDADKSKESAKKAGISEKELGVLRERAKSYTDENGYNRRLFNKLPNDLQNPNARFSDFKQAIEVLKSAPENQAKKPDAYYKDGEMTMAINEQMLASPQWKLEMKMKNNIFQVIVDRNTVARISDEKFRQMQEDGQLPTSINNKPFSVEMFNNLIQGKGGIDNDVARFVLGKESGTLKLGQPVQVDRTILGLIVTSVLITTVQLCIPPQGHASVEVTGGGW